MGFLRIVSVFAFVCIISSGVFSANYTFRYKGTNPEVYPGLSMAFDNSTGKVTLNLIGAISTSGGGDRHKIGEFNLTDLWADYFISCIRTFMEANSQVMGTTPDDRFRELALFIVADGDGISKVELIWGAD